MRIGFAIFLAFILLRSAACNIPGPSILILHSESGQIQIVGKSNLSTFSLTYPLADSIVVRDEYAGTFDLEIPIEDFETTFPRLKKDFEKLLQSDNYPVIAIRFKGINDLMPENQTNSLEVTVAMAGVSNLFQIPCTIDLLPTNKFCIQGHISISFSEFLLDPPVKALGLIKVEEMVDVLFQVNLTPYWQSSLTDPGLPRSPVL